MKLHRRDNLVDFVDGLIETEVFPYPDGQRQVIAATYVPVQEVTWKPGALDELTKLKVLGVKQRLDGIEKAVNMDITLTPDQGVGTYEVVYDVLKADSATETLMGNKDVERIRMAMWARYDWVSEKVAEINYLRWEAEAQAQEDDESTSQEDDDVDSNLSEELDVYDHDMLSSVSLP